MSMFCSICGKSITSPEHRCSERSIRRIERRYMREETEQEQHPAEDLDREYSERLSEGFDPRGFNNLQ